MPDNFIAPYDDEADEEDKKPDPFPPKYEVGDVVVTQRTVSTKLNNKKPGGPAQVGWRWVVKEIYKNVKGQRGKHRYFLTDKSGMYSCEIWEKDIWCKWEKLTTAQQAMAKSGREITFK